MSKSQYGTPVQELWEGSHPRGFEQGLFMVLRGYIDESGDDEQTIFTLSCLVADGVNWVFLDNDWRRLIEDKNQSLKAQGRRQISRYKAADCSSRVNEFEGWETPEQRDFTQAMVDILARYPVNVLSYSIDLIELCQDIPEVLPNPVGFAYVITLSYLMLMIGDNVLTSHPDALISLHHDHCDYDAALREAFNHMVDDPTFTYANRFVHLTPEYWQHCIPLQPADLLAYENYKEVERQKTGRPRRKSLELIWDLDSIGGRAISIKPESLKKMFYSLDEYTKEILLLNARVRAKTQSRGRNKGAA